MPLPIQVKLLRLENEWSQDLQGLQIYKKGTDQRKKSNTKTWTRRFRKSSKSGGTNEDLTRWEFRQKCEENSL